MITTYRLHINDLTTELLDSIKAKFKGREVEIIISDEVKEKEADSIRNYAADEDSFRFWMAEEEDLYEDYKKNQKE
jgi:hypothetical protein